MKRFRSIMLIFALIIVLQALCGCAAKPEGSRLDAIIKRGYIEVATEPAFAPNEFIDPSKTGNDKYVGSDIELAKYIAQELGVELRIVPLEFGAVLTGVSEGKYDLAISALAYKPDRAEAMILSKGYYFSVSSGHGLLIRESDVGIINSPDDLADKTVVAQSGSVQELFVEQQIPKYKEFKRVSSTADGFLMVQEKKADVSITAISTAQLYIDGNPGCGLAVVENFKFYQDESTLGTRIGIPLGEDELAERINKIIDDVLESGIYEQWYEEYSEYAKSLGVN